MAEDSQDIADLEQPTFFSAMLLIRRRRRKVTKAKIAAEEVKYLNIVAMMDMMTIILVFLLKSVSFATVSVSGSEAMTLPYSTTKVEPVEAIKVFVTKDEIVVEEKKAAELEGGAILPQFISPDNKYLIPNLKKLLDDKAERLAALKELNPQITIQDNLTILADKDTPYFVIVQILYTASKASGGSPGNEITFGTFRLTVLKKEA